MGRGALGLVLSAFLLACGGGATSTTGASDTTPTKAGTRAATSIPRVTLRVNARTPDGQLAPVQQGATLHSGDMIELLLEVDRPAYVYVLESFADGTATALFPESGDVQLQPGTTSRIPGVGDWYQLDQSTGDEHLYVIVSDVPIATADQAVAARVDEVRKTAPAAKPIKPQAHPVKTIKAPPKAGGGTGAADSGLSLASRGLVKVSESDAGVTVTADASGVGILHFSFVHAP